MILFCLDKFVRWYPSLFNANLVIILTWVTYVSGPDLFAHLYIVNEISICENLQFRISFMTFCYVSLPIYIHTPEGYSFSRKLHGINVRNLSTPPGTWYFLNSQRHDRWVRVWLHHGRSLRVTSICRVSGQLRFFVISS